MVYGGNSFEVSLRPDGPLDITRRSPHQKEMMRRVILVLLPEWAFDYRPISRACMNSRDWYRAFGSISRLTFIVGEREPHDLPWTERKLERQWKTALTNVLEFFGRDLPHAAQIVVDSNRNEEVTALVKEVLPGRCSFQELPEGDFWLKRAGYAMSQRDPRFPGVG